MTKTARLLNQSDFLVYDKFMEPRTAEAYFMRSNANYAGLDYNGNDLECEYIGVFDQDRLCAAVAYTWINTINAAADSVPDLIYAMPILKSLIKDRQGKIKGVATMKPEADFIIDHLQINDDQFCKNEDEGFYKLNIADLSDDYRCVHHQQVRLATTKDESVLIEWRTIFNIEQLGATKSDALTKIVTDEIQRRTKNAEIFVLENTENKELLSFHGMMGSIKTHQHIGPVYTPDEHRGRHYGRILLAETFRQAKATTHQELDTIGLFTANPSAIKLYESLGFKRINEFRLSLTKDDFIYS
jgi:ribosomal protein S18 acetylase RimI-like enzyme